MSPAGHFYYFALCFSGGDPSLATPDGRAVNEEVYEDKGKLVFDKRYRQADLPGLWVAGKISTHYTFSQTDCHKYFS